MAQPRMTAEQYQATAKRRNPRKRHTPGRMNALEAKFARYLETLEAAGVVESWEFEPGPMEILPRSGPKRRRITWTPDFFVRWEPFASCHVLRIVGELGRVGYQVLSWVDVKGHWEEDALLKIRMSAKMRPGVDHYAVKAKGDGWEWERFTGGGP